MKEQTLSRIAVIILAIVMIVFGFYHFMHPRDMLIFVPGFLPGGIMWVYVVGVAFIIAGIALILHKWVKLLAMFWRYYFSALYYWYTCLII